MASQNDNLLLIDKTAGTVRTPITSGGDPDTVSLSTDVQLSGSSISVGATAAARTVNVGTGAAAQTVNVGSTNTTSTTTVSAGSGGISLTATKTTVTGNLAVQGTTPTFETGLVYLGVDATARSVRSVTGVPGAVSPTPVAGDLALSSNGSAYLYSGSAWQSLIVAPAGATTQVQYNNAGAFGASANFTYSTVNGRLTLGGAATAGAVAANTAGDTAALTPTALSHTATGATTSYSVTTNRDLFVTSSSVGGAIRVVQNTVGGLVSVEGTNVQVRATAALTLGGASTYQMPLSSPGRGQVLQLPTSGGVLLNWAFGNQQEFGTLAAGSPGQADILANSYFRVNGAITLPTLSPSSTFDGLMITLVNNTLSTIAVTPPATVGGYDVQRTMTVGGGSQWVWSSARSTWMCVSNI